MAVEADWPDAYRVNRYVRGVGRDEDAVGADRDVIQLNREAMAQMRIEVQLELVRGASHLFEEPGALAEVARLAGNWFTQWLHAGEVISAAAAK